MKPLHLVALVVMLPVWGAALAAVDAPRASAFDTDVALGDAALDAMRGGFETGAGLQVNFGIERAVYLNGNLVTTTSLNVSDAMSATQAARAQAAGTSLGLIQSGTSNAFNAMTGPAAATTVIQNSLDNQKIQGITTITATANSLDLAKRADLSTSIQSALTGSLRR